jgi:diguanylate cyclase (GGDEF)-like protein
VIGLLFAVAAPVGLLTLQSVLAHKAPTIMWIIGELRAQPLVYGYLLLSTLVMLVCLGWIRGRKEDLLEAMTVTDPLTGLANRRRLRTQFAEELNRANRYGTPLALLLIDLDRLKLINDQAGHAAGDRALGLIAEALRRSCRTTDLAARHGGDEFIVLAVNTTATEALALAHRIRANVRRVGAGQIKGDNGEPLRLSVSIGAADLNGALAANFEGLHGAADHALYQAKADGRDRVVVAPQVVRTGTRLRLVQSSLPSNDR